MTILLTLLVLLLNPLPAQATITYNWTGICRQISPNPYNWVCTQATLHVVLTDAYIPGETIYGGPLTSTLLEALYVDDNITYDWAPDFNSILGWSLRLPDDTGDGLIYISLVASQFVANRDTGLWHAGGEEMLGHCDRSLNWSCGYVARGDSGVWTQVPAPSTLWLLSLGLLAAACRRRP